MKESKVVHYIRFLAFTLLSLLTALSYHSSFSNIVTEGIGVNPLSSYITILTIVIFTLSFNIKIWYKVQFLKHFFCGILSITLFTFVFFALGIESMAFSDMKDVLMAFIFILIGYEIHFSKNEIIFLIFSYSCVLLFSLYSQVLDNLGGFVIADQYIQYGKNTLGVMAASSLIAIVVSAFNLNSRYIKFLLIIWVFVILLFIITLRARAAFAMVGVVLFFIFLKYIASKKKNIRFYFVCFLLLCLFAFIIVMFSNRLTGVYEYVYSSITQNRETDLSSGRFDRNIMAIDIIMESPLFGNLSTQYTYEWIHNYFLRMVSSYGLVTSFPFVYLYLYLLIFVLKGVLSKKVEIENVALFVMLIPLLVSLLEPTFPYAPGTGILLPFVFLGHYIYNNTNPVI